jgi:hypothetical protein
MVVVVVRMMMRLMRKKEEIMMMWMWYWSVGEGSLLSPTCPSSMKARLVMAPS